MSAVVGRSLTTTADLTRASVDTSSGGHRGIPSSVVAPFANTHKATVAPALSAQLPPNVVPGPGHYQYELTGVDAHVPYAEAVFRSASQRFDEAELRRMASRAPRPNVQAFPSTLKAPLEPVTTPASWTKPVPYVPPSLELLHSLREGSADARAPSIPTKGQSYGYGHTQTSVTRPPPA